MTDPVFSSGFLTLWDSLAKPKTCPELGAAWNSITEQADLINPEGLNELWEFYLERLTEYEMGGGPMKLHSEKRNLLYRVTEWIGKKLSPQKNKPNHWIVWGPTRAGMTEIDPIKLLSATCDDRHDEKLNNDLLLLSKLDEYKSFCSEGADIVQKNIKKSHVIKYPPPEVGDL